jgi:hypothetical protein
MKAAVARVIGFLLPLLALSGCFDVKQVDPGSRNFPIDDFDDGDPLPTTPLFRRWWCVTFNPPVGEDPGQTVTCDLEDGNKSPHALFAAFTLHDPPSDNKPNYGGAGLLTTAEEPVDFRGYLNLAFSMKVEFNNLDSALGTAMVQAVLDCPTVPAEKEKQTGEYFQLVREIPATSAWTPFSLPLVNFTQPDWQKNHFLMGPSSCLGAIAGIHFEVAAALQDGQSGNGVIHIDDVHLH